jgi:hypothetical protein
MLHLLYSPQPPLKALSGNYTLIIDPSGYTSQYQADVELQE